MSIRQLPRHPALFLSFFPLCSWQAATYFSKIGKYWQTEQVQRGKPVTSPPGGCGLESSSSLSVWSLHLCLVSVGFPRPVWFPPTDQIQWTLWWLENRKCPCLLVCVNGVCKAKSLCIGSFIWRSPCSFLKGTRLDDCILDDMPFKSTLLVRTNQN